MTTYKLQFFSGAETEGETRDSAGYDGSMFVEQPHLEALHAAIPAYLDSMDCIYGQCFVAVAWEHDYGHGKTSTLHTLYIINRTYKED